jgi:hypothetical protein
MILALDLDADGVTVDDSGDRCWREAGADVWGGRDSSRMGRFADLRLAGAGTDGEEKGD